MNDFELYGKSLSPRQNVTVNNNTTNSGIGFTGMLFLVFLVLKLTHVINWSWWWVTAPLWGGLAAVLSLVIIAGLLALIAYFVGRRKKAFKKKR